MTVRFVVVVVVVVVVVFVFVVFLPSSATFLLNNARIMDF